MTMSLQLKQFNDKVKIMNQLNSKDLTLTAKEARDLHNEVFGLLAQIADLSKQVQHLNMIGQNASDVSMDGGTF